MGEGRGLRVLEAVEPKTGLEPRWPGRAAQERPPAGQGRYQYLRLWPRGPDRDPKMSPPVELNNRRLRNNSRRHWGAFLVESKIWIGRSHATS